MEPGRPTSDQARATRRQEAQQPRCDTYSFSKAHTSLHCEGQKQNKSTPAKTRNQIPAHAPTHQPTYTDTDTDTDTHTHLCPLGMCHGDNIVQLLLWPHGPALQQENGLADLLYVL